MSVTGIGFALSSGDLLNMLRRFYPAAEPAPSETRPNTANAASPRTFHGVEVGDPPAPAHSNSSSPAAPPVSSAPPEGDFGHLTITSDLDYAEIYVDARFPGNPPADLKLPAEPHTVLVKSPG
jgi:hypothetical protein